RLGDDAEGLRGPVVVHDHQGRHARVLHQVRGRGHMVARSYRGRRWPHEVRGCGRSMWRPVHGRLAGEGFGHDPLHFRGTPARAPRSVSRPHRGGVPAFPVALITVMVMNSSLPAGTGTGRAALAV